MTSTLSGKVRVSTPGAPAIRVESARSGTVTVSPGMVGPQGGGIRLDGAVPSYADLPTGLGVEDAGASFVTQDDGLLYVWSGTAWPPAGAGSQFRGDKGDRGTGVESVSVAGSDLSFGLSDGSSRRVAVPALVGASSDAAEAVGAADRAVSARAGAELARDGAVSAAGRAEGAAGGVAADAVTAGDAAGRAEVAAGDAAASAVAAGVSAGESAASATSAGASATAAAGDATAASGARDGAVSAADSAQGSATAAAVDADRAESAAAGVDQVVADAAVVLAGEFADDVAASQDARTGAESARDQAVGAASTSSTKAGEAAASATLADGRATDAEGAVASIAAHATGAEDAAGRAAVSESNAASSATTAQGHADRAATEAGAAAQIAAQEKITELVGSAPADLDTIYELASAFADRGDAIAAIQDALANRVMGNHSSVIASTAPGAGTPTNQITFVVEGT